MIVTVGVKALNEERHIETCLASALAAVAPYRGEVILGDCGSTDRTIEIAKKFPVRIFQLVDPSQRSCGAGAQLAFQDAKGAFYYMLDGDMVLSPEFLAAGIDYLRKNPNVAGVGGRVRQMNTDNVEYRIRAESNESKPGPSAGFVDRLDCGGLYRTDALRAVGYFADRNLHAFEEFELGARLQAAGWKLARIDAPAVEHYGHTGAGFGLLAKWLRTGYACAAGEVLRAAIGKPQLPIVVRQLGHVRNAGVVIVWWLLVLYFAFRAWPASLALVLLPIAFLTFRRKSLANGLYSFAMWNVYAYGLIAGLFHRRVPPSTRIDCVELSAN
jgi:glycosyltransferase involved in cell wall biosynthesis